MKTFHGMLSHDAMAHMGRVSAFAASYAKRGWGTAPVEYRGKAPASGWDGPRNIAVVLGAQSGHLADVDLDSPEAVALAARLLPPTVGFGHSGQTRHLLYVAEGAPTRRYTDMDGRVTLVELRANSSTGGGVLTVAPPSVHPNGQPLVWTGDGEPTRIDARELQQRVAMLAAACLVTRHGGHVSRLEGRAVEQCAQWLDEAGLAG